MDREGQLVKTNRDDSCPYCGSRFKMVKDNVRFAVIEIGIENGKIVVNM